MILSAQTILPSPAKLDTSNGVRIIARMKDARIFIEPGEQAPWCAGLWLPLRADQEHYLRRVLRLRDEEPIQVSDGLGKRWNAHFAPGAQGLGVTLASECPNTPEPAWRCVLVQGLSTGDKMDWTIEKAVELGVSSVIPLQAERSISRLAAANAQRKQAHWQSVAQAAALQCGRDIVPPVAPVANLEAVLEACASIAQRWVLSPEQGASLRDRVMHMDNPGTVAIAVGPESGWSSAELHRFVTAGWQCLSLGPRVLRTETAGLAALAGLEALLGAS